MVVEKPTHFVVFLFRNPEKPDFYHFDFRIVGNSEVEKLRSTKNFEFYGEKIELVALKKIHNFYLQDLEKYVESVWGRGKTRMVDLVLPGFEVGNIDYRVSEDRNKNKIAYSIDYYPKSKIISEKSFEDVSEKKLPGLGYYLEVICLNHLKKLGVTHVSTTINPSYSRFAQVKKAELPVGETVEISKWLKKIGSLGLRQKLGKIK